jgi:hypothetical protein
MKTQEHTFLEASWILMILTFIGVMALNLYASVQILKDTPKNELTGIFTVVVAFIVPIVVSRLLSFGRTTVTLTENAIKVKRSAVLSLIKSDINLPYSKVRKYVFQNDQNWIWLKIVDTDGKVYRIWRLAYFKTEEFRAFQESFENQITLYNQQVKTSAGLSDAKQIERAKNIYQGTVGLILGVLSVIGIVSVPILIFVFGIDNLRFSGPLLLGLSGAIFTLFKVLNERNTVANKT